MFGRKFIRIFSILVALACTTVMPTLTFVPASHAQTQDTEGSSSRPAEELEARFDLSESYDKAEIEANPYAPDDREQTATATSTSTSSTALWPIQPMPLPGGIDHVANGVGTRNAGFGHIRLRGVPPGSVAVRAYLYWGTIQNAPPATQTVAFNGTPVKGRLIGTGPTCWCGGVFAAYRASVIAMITPGINNDYRVSQMPSAVTNGSDPWDGNCKLPLSQGASLVVLYANASVPAAARVYINEGTAFFAVGGINTFNPLPVPVPFHTQLKHTRLGGDGQVGFSTFSNLPVTNERTFVGAWPFGFGPLTHIKGPGSPFNGDSDWNGDDGVPLNQLWDTHTDRFNIDRSRPMIPFGAPNYLVRYTANGDCIYAVAHVLGTR
jgi:hypothetical protein